MGDARRAVRFRVIPDEEGMTLRVLLSRRLGITKDEASALVKSGGVYVNKLRVRLASVRVAPGERVTAYPETATVTALDPASIRIVHRDPSFLVVDKDPGVPVTPTREASVGSLSDALIKRLQSEGVRRPYVGAVHRLDQPASGLVIFTIRGVANQSVHKQFREHQIRRIYRVEVQGEAPDTCTVEAALTDSRGAKVRVAEGGEPGALSATTHFARLARREGRDLLRAELETGRTHQIRVHAAHMGWPVVGDFRYGPDAQGGGAKRPLHLHAHELEFEHPTRGESVRVVSELPSWARHDGDGPA